MERQCPNRPYLAPKTSRHLRVFIHGGGGWIRTTEARASDLQSDPFGHSGTPPKGGTLSRRPRLLSTAYFNKIINLRKIHSELVKVANSSLYNVKKPGLMDKK